MTDQPSLPVVVPVSGTERPADVGEVIQIDPAYAWGPCFAIVSRVYSWGVQAFVFVPGSDARNPGRAPLRVEHWAYSVIGIAAWVPVESVPFDPGEPAAPARSTPPDDTQ